MMKNVNPKGERMYSPPPGPCQSNRPLIREDCCRENNHLPALLKEGLLTHDSLQI